MPTIYPLLHPRVRRELRLEHYGVDIALLTHIESLLSDPRAERRNLALALDEAVWRLYEAGSHIPLRWKVTLLKQNCSAKTICLVVCSTCGFSFARFKQILAFGVALKGMIFRQRREHRL